MREDEKVDRQMQRFKYDQKQYENEQRTSKAMINYSNNWPLEMAHNDFYYHTRKKNDSFDKYVVPKWL